MGFVAAESCDGFGLAAVVAAAATRVSCLSAVRLSWWCPGGVSVGVSPLGDGAAVESGCALYGAVGHSRFDEGVQVSHAIQVVRLVRGRGFSRLSRGTNPPVSVWRAAR